MHTQAHKCIKINIAQYKIKCTQTDIKIQPCYLTDQVMWWMANRVEENIVTSGTHLYLQSQVIALSKPAFLNKAFKLEQNPIRCQKTSHNNSQKHHTTQRNALQLPLPLQHPLIYMVVHILKTNYTHKISIVENNYLYHII